MGLIDNFTPEERRQAMKELQEWQNSIIEEMNQQQGQNFTPAKEPGISKSAIELWLKDRESGAFNGKLNKIIKENNNQPPMGGKKIL